jgi:hypothetical protein
MKNALLLLLLVATILVVGCEDRSKQQAVSQAKFSDAEYERYSEAKQKGLEKLLGPMQDTVGHAVIPFAVGGAMDMYYFPNGIPGTAFATMELIEPDGTGPKPNRIGTYELVAFTKRTQLPQEPKGDSKHPFTRLERRICGIFTAVGRYSSEAVLNPGETCEIPGDTGEPNTCLVFDEYQKDGVRFDIGGKRHCLLLCIEVFPSEMKHAMENGSASLLRKLKAAGHYPYSDLDREPVY